MLRHNVACWSYQYFVLLTMYTYRVYVRKEFTSLRHILGYITVSV
jgi:hypothetical protein